MSSGVFRLYASSPKFPIPMRGNEIVVIVIIIPSSFVSNPHEG